jgi:multimeric flavodoxin WrbA
VASAIALFASARRNGNTGAFMDRIAGELGIEVVDLAALSIAPYGYDHGHRGDDFEPLMRRVLGFDRILFASPVYSYAVAPPMKCFFDRTTDFLDLPELRDEARRLRGKTAYVVCTSVYEEVPRSFIGAFQENFGYFGMRFGGIAHANCEDGYDPERHGVVAADFVRRFRAEP